MISYHSSLFDIVEPASDNGLGVPSGGFCDELDALTDEHLQVTFHWIMRYLHDLIVYLGVLRTGVSPHSVDARTRIYTSCYCEDASQKPRAVAELKPGDGACNLTGWSLPCRSGLEANERAYHPA